MPKLRRENLYVNDKYKKIESLNRHQNYTTIIIIKSRVDECILFQK